MLELLPTSDDPAADLADLTKQVGDVPDPELPFLTLKDLGILRSVSLEDQEVVVRLTPTYSGCPATESIRSDVEAVLAASPFPKCRVLISLSPAWTTDEITSEGRRKLQENGMAPPSPARSGPVPLPLSVRCPHCGSIATEELSRFGSTMCTSLRRCTSCLEPFPAVKPL